MEFKDLVSTRRLQLKLTMEELGNKVGVSKATVQRWESGEITNVRRDKIAKLAKALEVSPSYLMGWEESKKDLTISNRLKGVFIPVLGKVIAGIPIEAIEDIIDYEEIDAKMAKSGEYFALQISGDSMEPKFSTGDVVIVRKQPTIESGQIAIVRVNGHDATVKKVLINDGGITLVPFNTAVYEPIFYSRKQIQELPVEIAGRVVELRAKF